VTSAVPTDRRHRKTTLELVAVLLLGIATVATAWCGFQSSRWNDRDSGAARKATDLRIESSRLFTLGAQKVAYDANSAAQYAQAVVNKQTELKTFLRSNVVRPEFLPTLDAWEAAVKAGNGSAANIFSNKEYLAAQFAPADAAQKQSDDQTTLSEAASKNSGSYVLITLLTATALFFAGVTTSFESKPARLLLLTLAALTLALAASRMISLPIA
jgi:hypothetical protein